MSNVVTGEEQDGQRRSSWRHPSPMARVLLFGVLLLAAAAGIYLVVLQNLGLVPGAPVTLRWWQLVPGFAVAEVFVIHLQFRRDAHSISLNEIPIVLSLFFASPEDMLVAHLVGAALALAFYRRQPVLKLAFNLMHFAVEGAVAIVVFRSLVGDSVHLGPRIWIAAFAAALSFDLLAGAIVSMVISIHAGRRGNAGETGVSHLRRVVTAGTTTALVNSSLSLVAVTALYEDRRSIWLLAGVAAVLLIAYRAYSSLSERHASLELLYQFTRAVSRSQKSDQVVHEVLLQAKQLLRADYAEVTLLGTGDKPEGYRVSLGRNDVLRSELLPAAGLREGPLGEVFSADEPVLLPRSTKDAAHRAHLIARGFADMVIAPLGGDDGVIGAITVADRLGDVSTFQAEDARLFETIANHASVALQNGRLIERLRHEALHDALTGLPNRTLFLDLVRQRLEAARVRGTMIAVMLMDLDRFKDVNDSLGHHIGDVLLQEVGTRLRAILQADVIIARLGGDEFGVLLSDVESPAAATQSARLIQVAIERPFQHEELSLEVGATIGIALFPGHGDDAATLLKRADVAMYDAKGQGAGVGTYEPSADKNSPRRLTILGDLRGAIEEGTLEVHYQPKADLRTGNIVGAEALVRWQHPDLGPLRPDEFIPLAEHSGLIGHLTIYVLGVALAECQRWQTTFPGLTVAVNLSARTLLDLELPDTVGRLLTASRLVPELLTLEITESSVMSDPARTIGVLERIRAMGVHLSVDDFGTGYSSLSYLKRLPVHEVKIDKSFVLSMAGNPSDAAIVRSIVDLGRNLGLAIVAEGIEDLPTWRKLVDLGCHLGQGYFLSRPISGPAFRAWLADHHPLSDPTSPLYTEIGH